MASGGRRHLLIPESIGSEGRRAHLLTRDVMRSIRPGAHVSIARVVLVLLALGIALRTTPAIATEPASDENIRLAYVADRACPSESSFVSAVRRHTEKFRLVTDEGARRLFDVELREIADGARGRLAIVDRRRGTKIQRELTGPDCEMIARGIALMIALAIDPQALSVAPPAEPETPRDPISPARPDRHEPSAPARPPPPRPRRSLGIAVDVQMGFTRAVIAKVLPFLGATVELKADILGWHPVLGLGVRQSLPKEMGIAGGEVQFLWTAGALDLCPHRFVAGRFELVPCIEGGLGVLQVDAHGLPRVRPSANRWIHGSALLWARWRVTTRWLLTTTVDLTAPVTRHRFELSSGDVISQAPRLGIGAGFGMAFEL